MKTKGIKLTEEILDAALYGGTILGQTVRKLS